MLTIKTAGFEEYLDPSGGAWIKALVLGQHGCGKTRSSAFWPDPIIADCERGLMSVSDLGTPYAHITSSSDMDALLEVLRKDSMQAPEKRKYRTFVLDTVDSYQRTLVSERLKSERKESMSGWADWGWLNGKMAQLIEKLLNLPINVVVNMHVKDEKDEDGESSILVKKSALKGESGDTIYRDFDLIGLMETSYTAEDGERVLHRQIRWHSEPKFPMLRDRSGRLPRFTDVDFTTEDYSRIFNAITAGVDNLPETTTLEEIGTEDEAVQPAGPDASGGPVDNPKLPKNPPVKKAAAKKAVKGAHAVKSGRIETEEQGEPVDAPKAEEPAEDPWAPPATDVAADAQALVESELGATVVETDEPAPPIKGDEPEPAKPKGNGSTCGDVKPGMDGDPSLGCGKALTQHNGSKRAMAQLRTKTVLCDDCFETWKSNN